MNRNLAPPPRPRHEPPWLEPREVAPARPRAVNVSAMLWLTAAVAGLATIGLTLAELDQVRETIVTEVTRRFPNESPATKDRVGSAALGVIVAGGALISLLQAGFGLALRSRRRAFRVALVLVWLISLGHGLVAAAAVPQPALVGAAAAAAFAGLVWMFLPTSNQWFASRGGSW